MRRTYNTFVGIFGYLDLNTIVEWSLYNMIVCQRQKHAQGNQNGKTKWYVSFLFTQLQKEA